MPRNIIFHFIMCQKLTMHFIDSSWESDSVLLLSKSLLLLIHGRNRRFDVDAGSGLAPPLVLALLILIVLLLLLLLLRLRWATSHDESGLEYLVNSYVFIRGSIRIISKGLAAVGKAPTEEQILKTVTLAAAACPMNR